MEEDKPSNCYYCSGVGYDGGDGCPACNGIGKVVYEVTPVPPASAYAPTPYLSPQGYRVVAVNAELAGWKRVGVSVTYDGRGEEVSRNHVYNVPPELR